MNTINCRIKLNDHADVSGVDVTPAEVIVLRHIHDKNAGGCCIKKPRKSGKALMEDPETGESRPRTPMEEYYRLRTKYPQRASPDKPNSSFLDELFPGAATGAVKLPTSFDDLPQQYHIGEIAEPRPRFLRTKDTVKARATSTEEQEFEEARGNRKKNPVLKDKEAETGRPAKAKPAKDTVPEKGTDAPEGAGADEGAKEDPNAKQPGGPVESYEGKSVAELKEIAKDYGLKLAKNANKAAIVAAIQKAAAEVI